MEVEVAHLEEGVRDIKAILVRLEPSITRIDAQIHLAAKDDGLSAWPHRTPALDLDHVDGHHWRPSCAGRLLVAALRLVGSH